MFIPTELIMIKTVLTLVRGAAAAAEEELVDRNALWVLDQQIRDATAAIARSKRALALAIAQDEAEGRRLEATLTRIADLETRTVAALTAGREDLAQEAAEAIALMEADRDAIKKARASFAAEATQLKACVTQASQRLAELERGRRIAQAAEAVRRMKVESTGTTGAACLAEAETTLRRLRERQAQDTAAAAALDRLDAGTAPDGIAHRLEAAGFGPRTRPTADSVLQRLRPHASAAPIS
jgi:phage shock protein A